jgi:hypothetical protein
VRSGLLFGAFKCGRCPIAILSLLKIQFCAIEGKGQASATSPFLRGSTFIAMMQAANLWEGNNVMACRG